MFDPNAEYDGHLDDWHNEADAALPEDHPAPLLWRVLVVPRKPPTKSKGGLLIAQNARDAERHLNYIGQVVALGELAFKSEVFRDMTHIPQVGDWVIYGRHAGQPLLYKGCRFLVCDDKQILCTVPNPDGLTVYI